MTVDTQLKIIQGLFLLALALYIVVLVGRIVQLVTA